jgi:ATP-dependent DNA helicase RecQ
VLFRSQRLLAYFGEDSPPCGNCDLCLEPPETWDGTEVARKALSCVYRTEQRFGAGHVIDVLLGHDTERIRQWGHQNLTTYGIGKELSDKEWRAVFRQLVALGYLEVDVVGFGALKLSPSSRPLLKGAASLTLRRQAERKKGKEARRTGPGEALDATGRDLFERLRTWRGETAKAHGVPAYVIFHDATLAAIAAALPRVEADLRRIPGIGAKKLEHYGDALLELCRDYAGSDMPVTSWVAEPAPRSAPAYPGLSESAGVTLSLLEEGLDIVEIAARRQLKEATIWNHCAEAIAQGLLDPQDILPLEPEEVEPILEAFREQGETGEMRLTPVFERFEGKYDYGLLRCVAALL